jgi:hypothetical protein
MEMGTVEPIGGTDAIAFIRGAIEKYQGKDVDEELLQYIREQIGCGEAPEGRKNAQETQ